MSNECRRRLAALALAIVVRPGAAWAQSTPNNGPAPASQPGRFFAEAGILADREEAWIPAWRPGAVVAIGGFLTPQRSLRVAVRVPGWGDREFERLFDYDDPQLRAIVRGPVLTTSGVRTIVSSAEVGFHYRTERTLKFAFDSGLGWIVQSTRITNVVRDTGRVINSGTSTQRAVAAVIGVESEWAFSSRLALVAQVMAHVGLVRDFNEATTLMPSVVLRWR